MNMAAKPRIVRGLAVLFLLFTLVDIGSPPACCENAELLSAARDNSARLVAGTAYEETSIPTSSQSGSEQSPDKGCGDEDCCLLCAHMLPVKVLAAEFVLDLNSPSLVFNETLIPSPSLDTTYHPPRFL
jgi:hypothetical protein